MSDKPFDPTKPVQTRDGRAAEWQPISTAPKDGRRLLMWDGFSVFEGLWNGEWCMPDDAARPWTYAWQPMPEPPPADNKLPRVTMRDGKIRAIIQAALASPAPLAQSEAVHASDCAVYSEPASRMGPCDCGAVKQPP